MKRTIAATVACFALTASTLCKHVDAQPLKTIRVESSPDTVSTLTETPSGDYLVPESQVFIGSRGGVTRWLSLLGVAIDSARNESATGGSGEALRIKFAPVLTQALSGLDERNVVPGTKFVAVTDAHDAKLLPSARFLVQDDGQAQLTFRLTARTKRDGSSEVTKNYYYTAGAGPRLLTGTGSWTDDNAKLVHAEATVAIARLAEAFALDAAGMFADAMLPEKQRIITVTPVKAGAALKVLLLGQTTETLITHPMLRDRPLHVIVYVFERSNIRVDGL